MGSISLNAWRWQANRPPCSSLPCPTSCSSHNAVQLLHTIPAPGCVQTNRHINTFGDIPKQLHHMSLDRTTVRLKGTALGAGCIREIRRGLLLWRADLFNHVRHSGLSFCPFYYDILAPSSALSCHSLPSRYAIRVRSASVPGSRLCVDPDGSWHARTTHNQPGKSSLDCIMSIFWGGQTESNHLSCWGTV